MPAGRKLSVYERVVTGRVREPTYRHKLRAALSGGIAARVGSFRFMGVSSPGGLGHYRIRIGCVAALKRAHPENGRALGVI